MGKRVGLLAGLLILVLGSGVMARESSPGASPEATPVYAPDNLALVLEHALTRAADWSVDGGGDAVMVEYWGLDAMQDLVDAVGKVQNDVRFASGSTVNQPLDDMLNLNVLAVRVAGTPADMLVEPLVQIVSGMPLDEWPPEASVEWRDIEDRKVLVLLDEVQPDDWDDYGAGQQRWLVLYPKGEVLFVGIKDGVVPLTIDEVLANLP